MCLSVRSQNHDQIKGILVRLNCNLETIDMVLSDVQRGGGEKESLVGYLSKFKLGIEYFLVSMFIWHELLVLYLPSFSCQSNIPLNSLTPLPPKFFFFLSLDPFIHLPRSIVQTFSHFLFTRVCMMHEVCLVLVHRSNVDLLLLSVYLTCSFQRRPNTKRVNFRVNTTTGLHDLYLIMLYMYINSVCSLLAVLT